MTQERKAFIYTRVSTLNQVVDGQGLDVQLRLCRDHCKADGLQIVGEFTDPGISGSRVDRPGLEELLARIDEVDVVVVSSTSRLWRDIYPQALVIKALRDRGKDIVAVDEPAYTIYTDNDPSQFLVSSILGVLDVWERLSITQRLGRGRAQKASAGSKASGSAPFGYRWVSKGRGKQIAIEESEAEVVREAFLLLLRHRSVGKVRKGLAQLGHRNRRGSEFSWQALRNLLANDFYVGVVRHGDLTVKVGNHEPIVSNVVFGKAQKALYSRRDTRSIG